MCFTKRLPKIYLMKKLLFVLVMLCSLQSFAQFSTASVNTSIGASSQMETVFADGGSKGGFKKTFPELNVGIMAPTGFVAEIGKNPVKGNVLGYFVGASTEFGDEVSNGFDLSVYAKGQLYLIKHLHATLHVGLVDYTNFQVGVGLKGFIPTGGPDIFIEPILRTGGSVVNIGLHTKF